MLCISCLARLFLLHGVAVCEAGLTLLLRSHVYAISVTILVLHAEAVCKAGLTILRLHVYIACVCHAWPPRNCVLRRFARLGLQLLKSHVYAMVVAILLLRAQMDMRADVCPQMCVKTSSYLLRAQVTPLLFIACPGGKGCREGGEGGRGGVVYAGEIRGQGGP